MATSNEMTAAEMDEAAEALCSTCDLRDVCLMNSSDEMYMAGDELFCETRQPRTAS